MLKNALLISKPRAEKDERWNITELSGSPLKQNVMIS